MLNVYNHFTTLNVVKVCFFFPSSANFFYWDLLDFFFVKHSTTNVPFKSILLTVSKCLLMQYEFIIVLSLALPTTFRKKLINAMT